MDMLQIKLGGDTLGRAPSTVATDSLGDPVGVPPLVAIFGSFTLNVGLPAL